MFFGELTDYITHLDYVGILLWFMVIEQFTPIPEEVSLITIGHLSVHTALNPLLAGAAALVGLLTTDSALFYFTLSSGKLVQKILKRSKPGALLFMREKLNTKPVVTLFVAGLLPKLRFFSPVLAATLKISWRLYFIVDTAATLF